MWFLEYAIQRVRGVLGEIENLKDEDFPYRHSRLALDEIERNVSQRLDLLSSLNEGDDPTAVKTACNESLQQLFRILPLLGFIVRSTNVRNSFEVFWPLLRLARLVLQTDVKLVLSSEWQYSPFYRPSADLSDFVLLGFPASESGNPLLVPLAGHELGHTTWQQHQLEESFGPQIQKNIIDRAKQRATVYKELFGRDLDDLFAPQDLAPAYQCALRQAEETFCDFLGLRLFGMSYLHAFGYLLTPGGINRSPEYPKLKTRIQNLESGAKQLGFSVPPAFAEGFLDDSPVGYSDKDRFLLALADNAAQSVTDELLTRARDIADAAPAPMPVADVIERIKRRFRLLTPASGVGDLTNILAAAWDLYYDTDLWAGTIPAEKRVDTLNELVLKCVEIMEFEERTKAVHDPEI